MNILYPWAGALTIGLLLLMTLWHVLRPRARPYRVASLWLWRTVTVEQRAMRPWTPPHPWWLWLLRSMVVACIGAAAMAPSLPSTDVLPPTVLIAIDRSASMATVVDGMPRIQQAKRYAHALVDALTPESVVTIVAFDRSVEVLASQLRDRTMAHTIIDGIEPRAVAGDFAQLQRWAQLSASPRQMLYVIGDDVALFAADQSEPWRALPVGGRAANLGITGVRVRQTATDWYVEVRVDASGPAPAAPRLISASGADGQILEATQLEWMSTMPLQWQFNLASMPAILHITLEPHAADTLVLDDSFVWQADTTGQVVVDVTVDDGVFLPAALRSLPNVTLADPNAPSSDLLITDDVTILPRPLTQGVWLINPRATNSLITTTTRIETPRIEPITVRAPTANLLRDVDIMQLELLRAGVLQVPYWAQPWLQSSAGIHAVAGLVDGYPVVVSAFDIRESNLPLRSDFPILVRNIITYLTPPMRQTVWQTGEVIPLATINQPLPVVRDQPNGGEAVVTSVGDWYVLRNAWQVGAYRIDDRWYALTIGDARESAVDRPTPTFTLPAPVLPSGLSLTTWLGVFGLLGLMLERGMTWYMGRST